MHILMVAAENGALPGGKIGGMGDVTRDVPRALVARGHDVGVVTPSYGFLHRQPGFRWRGRIDARWRGGRAGVEVFARQDDSGVTHWLLEHPEFSPWGPGHVYCDDPPGQPFASDANKFALLCSATCYLLQSEHLPTVDVLHLHDWHAGLIPLLLHNDPELRALRDTHTVFSLHNLSVQGLRPMEHHPSSMRAWFPDLWVEHDDLRDPRYPHCANPLRSALWRCQHIHAVSPTYAREIQSEPMGHGLAADLRRVAANGRLHGILNGCEYPKRSNRKPAFKKLVDALGRAVDGWLGRAAAEHAERTAIHLLALRRIEELGQRGRWPAPLLTSIGRVTGQKLGLLREPQADGRSTLDHILDRLPEDGQLFLLGSGDPVYERFLAEVAGRRPQLLFLCGYSDPVAEALYGAGDLFLMPSTFEPCGISQMLAMRAAQPCLVNRVGGLVDTVEDGRTGFAFRGRSAGEQTGRLLERLDEALALRQDDPKGWRELRERAARVRFTWDAAAERYEALLYRH